MNNYVNAFQCFSNNEHSEFVIHFYQDTPVLEDSEKKVSIEREQVAALVMNKALAHELVGQITDILQK